MLAPESSLNSRAATPGLSGTPANVTLTWFLSAETPRTTISSMRFTSSFTMVPDALLKLDKTSSSTLYFFANSTDLDINTFAPELANSSISSYATSSSFRACFTIRGSAE